VTQLKCLTESPIAYDPSDQGWHSMKPTVWVGLTKCDAEREIRTRNAEQIWEEVAKNPTLASAHTILGGAIDLFRGTVLLSKRCFHGIESNMQVGHGDSSLSCNFQKIPASTSFDNRHRFQTYRSKLGRDSPQSQRHEGLEGGPLG